MPLQSRLEMDFIRLLNRCQQDVNSGALTPKDWRFEKVSLCCQDTRCQTAHDVNLCTFCSRVQYVEGLEDRLTELTKLTACQPSRETLANYRRKTRFLKGLLETEKINDASERLVAAQILYPKTGHHKDKTQNIFFKSQSKFRQDVRDELLPRKRTNTVPDSDDTDLVIKYHHDMQEKVAAEMVSLAHNLKSNLKVANEIIRKDVEVLEGTSRHAETSLSGLKQNSDRLTDFVRRSCQYWLWISLFLVCMTFLWIVVFIRMFPKRL